MFDQLRPCLVRAGNRVARPEQHSHLARRGWRRQSTDQALSLLGPGLDRLIQLVRGDPQRVAHASPAGHEFAGVVTCLGYGTARFSLGQRVFGIADWHREGTLAEYVAVEARNLAPLPGNVEFTVGASLPISGLTAWQGLLRHGRVQAGQSVLAHGAAGAVGSVVTQLAREFGAYVIGTGRAADRQAALDFGANEFLARVRPT